MCSRATIAAKTKAIAERYGGINSVGEWQNQEETIGFANPLFPVITQDKPDTVQYFHWGLIPRWAADPQKADEIRNVTINARSETIWEKPAYKHLPLTNRCLIPVSSFFEYQTVGKEKIKYEIGVVDEQIFSIAGLHDAWVNRTTGEILFTFTMLTVVANELMAEIHNTKKRMPVIFEKSLERQWLNSELTEEEIKDMLTQFPSEKMWAKPTDENRNQQTRLF